MSSLSVCIDRSRIVNSVGQLVGTSYPEPMTPTATLNDDIRLLGRTLGDVIADQAGTATLDLEHDRHG